MNISDNITFKEATYSETAIREGLSNIPSQLVLSNMVYTAEELFQPLRELLDEPIYINSFYRSPEVNVKVGGEPTSQHCLGEAMDIRVGYDSEFDNKELFELILQYLTFDQLIWEFGTMTSPAWVHVSLREEGNRFEVLKTYKSFGKTVTKHW